MKKGLLLLLAVLQLGLLAACVPPQVSSSASLVPSLPSSVAPSAVSAPPVAPAPPPMAYPWPDATAINPLTGLARPEGMAPGQRPVAVMVANNPAALPQRGIAQADVLYEMLAEGSTTRLMAVYGDYRTLPQVGPVSATQDSFLQFALPGQYIVSHINNTVYGRNLLQLVGYKTVEGIFTGSAAFYFDETIHLPRLGGKTIAYCWFTDAALLWTGMEYIDVAPTAQVPPLFVFGDSPPVTGGEAFTITLTFLPTSVAGFGYDEATGVYFKSFNGQPHAQQDGTPLAFTNIIVMETAITPKPDGINPEFALTEGQGMYFTQGKMQLLHWKKGSPTQPLELYDEAGAPLQVLRGKTYIGIVPKIEGASAVVIGGRPQPPPPAPVAESVPPPAQEAVPPPVLVEGEVPASTPPAG